MAKKTIVICSSGSFYEHVNDIAKQLETRGLKVVVPATAAKMAVSGDYDIEKVKTWVNDPAHFGRKHKLAMGHFEEVAKSDAILIVNDDKDGQAGYLGPNTIMEWGLAYYLGKPVFILNGVAKDHNAYEEVYGLSTAVLDGNLDKIRI